MSRNPANVVLLLCAVVGAPAAGLTRLMRTLLYEVSPLDPILYAGLGTLLIAVALLATYLLARQPAL